MGPRARCAATLAGTAAAGQSGRCRAALEEGRVGHLVGGRRRDGHGLVVGAELDGDGQVAAGRRVDTCAETESMRPVGVVDEDVDRDGRRAARRWARARPSGSIEPTVLSSADGRDLEVELGAGARRAGHVALVGQHGARTG